MRTTVLIGALLLAGCDSASLLTGWERAPYTYTCTVEEQGRVQVESAWCTKNTSYLSTYCYGAATMRICTPKNSQASRP
jgi:hypothetical protein